MATPVDSMSVSRRVAALLKTVSMRLSSVSFQTRASCCQENSTP